ncbi:MAG: histidine phosphatase family protein [Oscillospiraceae bacterium]|nr:histidine phosphatase family protein [Oscillospiraceae bacterium]
MTTIYLIRHAEAEGNVFGRVHGQYDSPVTAKGREQIACLERRFAEIPVDAVYSSDLRRAMQTAEAIYVPKGLTLHTRPDLREIGFGSWEDLTYGELMRTHMEEMMRFSTGAPDWKTEDGESMAEVTDRMERAVREIAARHPGETVCVVSHGTALRLLLTRLTGSPAYLHEGFNTAVSRVEAEGDDLRVSWYNDSDHLTDKVMQRAVRPNTDVSERKQAPPNMFWFRPWDAAKERSQ